MPVQSQGLQLLRAWMVGGLVVTASAACGFGTGRHDDDNRNRRGPMECARIFACTDSTHWDGRECRCVDNQEIDGGAVDGASFDQGRTGAEGGDDGNQ